MHQRGDTPGYEPVPSSEDTEAFEAARRPGDAEAKSARKAYLAAVHLLLASGAWLAASSAIILVNRHVMVNLRFAYPMALSALGMAGR